jgi:hypothetical protein
VGARPHPEGEGGEAGDGAAGARPETERGAAWTLGWSGGGFRPAEMRWGAEMRPGERERVVVAARWDKGAPAADEDGNVAWGKRWLR